MAPISDREAKAIFLDPKRWPRWTSVFSFDQANWMQCRPRRVGNDTTNVTFPHLHTAGSLNFWIDPDCLYIRVSGNGSNLCCDVIAIEVCNTQQNFQQKRGRYVGTESSVFVNLPNSWLRMPVEVHKSCSEYLFSEKVCNKQDMKVPVRTLRVMYFLDPDYFKEKDRIRSIDVRPWEYILPNTSIKSLSSTAMRGFVRSISPDAQFYGWS